MLFKNNLNLQVFFEDLPQLRHWAQHSEYYSDESEVIATFQEFSSEMALVHK